MTNLSDHAQLPISRGNIVHRASPPKRATGTEEVAKGKRTDCLAVFLAGEHDFGRTVPASDHVLSQIISRLCGRVSTHVAR